MIVCTFAYLVFAMHNFFHELVDGELKLQTDVMIDGSGVDRLGKRDGFVIARLHRENIKLGRISWDVGGMPSLVYHSLVCCWQCYRRCCSCCSEACHE